MESGRLERLLPLTGAVFALFFAAAFAGPAGFIAFLAFPIWMLIVSIVLFTRQSRVVAGPFGPTATN